MGESTVAENRASDYRIAVPKKLCDWPLRDNPRFGSSGWFGTGGPAARYIKLDKEEDLVALLQSCAEPDIYVFGALSNTIVRQGGLDGIVIRLGRLFTQIRQVDSHMIYAGAMAPDKNVARFAAEAGIAGFEFLSSIPGTVGGAIKMNAGCYGRETKDILVKAYGYTRQGQPVTYTPQELEMDYRRTLLPQGVVLTGALLRGERGDTADIEGKIAAMQERRNLTQPVREKTGGSTFANPERADLEGAGLPAETRSWQLIEKCGGRGLGCGGAVMSQKHCNFMINTGNATACDLEDLGEEIRRRVYEESGVTLRWEIRRVGTRPPPPSDRPRTGFWQSEKST